MGSAPTFRRMRSRLLAWLMPVLICTGCGSLPVVATPTRAFDPGQDTKASAAPIRKVSAQEMREIPVIGKEGRLTPQQAVAEIRETQNEGRQALLAHHLAILGDLGESMTSDNEVKLLVDGPATFKAMFASLESAKQSIKMESYIFEDESLGEDVAKVLKRKAASGVKVHLIYDAVGSLTTPASFFDDLRKSGIAVCEFNPVNPLKITKAIRLNNRDHRKILVVDTREAFTGGINISGVYSAGSSSVIKRKKEEQEEQEEQQDGKEPERGWRDTHISIKGPAVADFSALFVDTWQRQHCENGPAAVPRQATPTRGDRLVTVLGSKPGDAEPRIYRSLLSAMAGAQRSIHLTMSYFVPDPQTVRILIEAAQRGVDVTLILQGKSDTNLVMRAGQSHYSNLMKGGVKLYERTDTLLHAKTAVIDGVWSSVGTSNIDWRSFLHNDEVNVIVLGAEFASELEALFQKDLAQAKRITPEEWSQRGLGRRFMEMIGRLFEYWL